MPTSQDLAHLRSEGVPQVSSATAEALGSLEPLRAADYSRKTRQDQIRSAVLEKMQLRTTASRDAPDTALGYFGCNRLR